MKLSNVIVRLPRDASQPLGTLRIDDWEIPCQVGQNGLTEQSLKREGDHCTPIGLFPLRYGFFDPINVPGFNQETLFPMVPLDEDMKWEEDIYSPYYNQLVRLKEGDEEKNRLTRFRSSGFYDIIIPIGYNDAPARKWLGSAHFIHAINPDHVGTHGCVAVARNDLEELARRLQPGMMIDINFEEAGHLQALSQSHIPEETLLPIEAITFSALRTGPKLLILGAVHGNEVCGPIAIQKVLNEFKSGKIKLQRGQVTFIPVVNYKAYLRNTREGDRNLNRDLREAVIPQDNEDQIANILCPILRNHDVLLDIHSFKSQGVPFVFTGPENNKGILEPFSKAEKERALAHCLGVDLIMSGWLKTFASGYPHQPFFGVGTTEFMRFAGGYAVTLECGNHSDIQSPDIACKAILNTLAHLEMIDALPPTHKAKQHIQLEQVFLAESEDDQLKKAWKTADSVQKGDVIAVRKSGEILVAPENGFIVFPNATVKKGETLFYFAKEV